MAFSILHVSQPTEAGVARCVADLARDQVARGWEVVVACPGEGLLARRVREAGARHAEWPAVRAVGPAVAGELLRLGRVLAAARPGIVHLHSSKAGLVGRLARRGGVPTVFQPHAWSFHAVRGLERRAALAWERRAARLADVVVCVSDAERQEGVGMGIRASWRVVPNGVDTAALPVPSAEETAALRERLGLPDAPLALSVGRVSEQKGQDLLVAAWPEVRRRVPDAELVLVGEGPERASLEARAPAGVRFVGRRDDVPDWLGACDVLVNPSRWEGLSYVLLEAMARGRPVVATDVAGTHEALGGDAGAIVPAGDRAALADAVVARLVDGDLRRREGLAGRRRVEERFELRAATARMAELYSALAAGARVPVRADR